MSRSGTAGRLDFRPALTSIDRAWTTRAIQLLEAGSRRSADTHLCDSGARYATTYHDDGWLAEQGIDYRPYLPRGRTGLGP
jgi:hypothetical protein